MKKITVFLAGLFLSVSSLTAQSPYIWGREGVNPPNPMSNNEGQAVAVDPAGNVFAAGYFTTSSTTFGSVTLTNPLAQEQIYLVKYDPNGNVLWAKTVTGAQQSLAYGLAADDSGNVYMTGRFTAGGAVTFAPIVFSASSAPVFFLAKYNSNGDALWVQRMGQHYISFGEAVAVDNAGGVYVAGASFDDSITFDTITVHSTYPGMEEVYLAKFTTTGHVLWVQHFGSNDFTVASALTVDPSNNVYITGTFDGPDMIVGTDTLVNPFPGNNEIYIARFSSSGNYAWSKSYGGINSEITNAICSDRRGHLFLGGTYYGPTITLGTNTYTMNGYSDAFIAKLNDSDGTITWSRATGSTEADNIYSICTDSTGHIFFTGGFGTTGPANSAYSMNFGTTVLTKIAGSLDPAFIIEMDTALNVVHNLVMQTGGDDMLAIQRDPTSPAIYISGDARNNPWNIGVDTLYGGINSGEYIVTLKLNFNNNALSALTTGSNGTDCNNPCSGSAQCTASGGMPPYSYHWMPGNMTTPVVNGLCAGTYTVVVYDQAGDSITNFVTVNYVSAGPTLTFSITPVSCYGLCDGAYIASVNGGVSPYAFSGQPSANGLCPGTYPLTVIDMNACMFTANAVITQPNQLNVSMLVTDASCSTCADGILTANVSGGTSPYNFNWQPGNFTGNPAVNLLPGTYTCCVTDTNGCQTCVIDSVLVFDGTSESVTKSPEVFPNPAESYLNIIIPPGIGNVSARIYSVRGELLSEQTCSGNTVMNIEEFADGVYFIEIQTGESITRKMFVKQ